jgi:hypothetical protein
MKYMHRTIPKTSQDTMDNALYRATFELTINSPLPGFDGMAWLMPSDEAAFYNLVKEYSREANITEIEAVQFIKMKLELDLFGNDLITGSKELHWSALPILRVWTRPDGRTRDSQGHGPAKPHALGAAAS